MANGYWGGHILIDPRDLENMFTYEDLDVPTVWDELQEESFGDMDKLPGLLDRIPPREADFIELYYLKRVRQTSIAELFNVSQPTVFYRLSRGVERIKFLLDLPKLTPEEIEAEIRGITTDEKDIQVMVLMAKSTCQSEVARELGLTQGFVRYRFIRTLDLMRSMTGMETLVSYFEKIQANPNILFDNCRFDWKEEAICTLC